MNILIYSYNFYKKNFVWITVNQQRGASRHFEAPHEICLDSRLSISSSYLVNSRMISSASRVQACSLCVE